MPAAILVALLLVSSRAPAQQADQQAAGLDALDRGDYSKAEEIFARLAAADAKDYSALFNLALSEAGQRKDAAATEHLKQVLSLKPGLYEAELNLGLLYLRNKQAADALPLLRDAASQKPDQARAKRYLADALLATGDADAAAQAYRDVLTLDPKMASAELGLGQSLVRRGKLDDALPHYTRAAELDPHLKSYPLELAEAFSKANRANDAIAIFQQFPADPGPREELGRIYLEQSKPADAVTQFQAAVNLSPSPANKLALATAYLKNNQPDLAAPILDDALRSNPNDYDVRMAIGRIQRDKKSYRAAADQFLEAAKLKPDSVEAWNEAASSLTMAEEYPQALSALDRVHALGAEKAGDFYLRAIIFEKLHQPKPALANYQRFLQLSHGEFPDQEFIARHRSIVLEKEAAR
ncbi:MAG: tetratricopeptide repeat protein [Acidobacteriaceae bacterium]|nr:tetratricopeptide repeat protein [Acidobacteriaceae bacterium]